MRSETMLCDPEIKNQFRKDEVESERTKNRKLQRNRSVNRETRLRKGIMNCRSQITNQERQSKYLNREFRGSKTEIANRGKREFDKHKLNRKQVEVKKRDLDVKLQVPNRN